MSYDALLKALRPKDWGEHTQEDFAEYYERAQELLPTWPKCALENWLYRHYPYAIGDYAWLRFDEMIFTKEEWPPDKVFTDISSHRMETINGFGWQMHEPSIGVSPHHEFSTERIWPAPIIILDNKKNLKTPSGTVLGTPFHLLEGHLRLGYFREVFKTDRESLKDEYPLWVVTTP